MSPSPDSQWSGWTGRAAGLAPRRCRPPPLPPVRPAHRAAFAVSGPAARAGRGRVAARGPAGPAPPTPPGGGPPRSPGGGQPNSPGGTRSPTRCRLPNCRSLQRPYLLPRLLTKYSGKLLVKSLRPQAHDLAGARQNDPQIAVIKEERDHAEGDDGAAGRHDRGNRVGELACRRERDADHHAGQHAHGRGRQPDQGRPADALHRVLAPDPAGDDDQREGDDRDAEGVAERPSAPTTCRSGTISARTTWASSGISPLPTSPAAAYLSRPSASRALVRFAMMPVPSSAGAYSTN